MPRTHARTRLGADLIAARLCPTKTREGSSPAVEITALHEVKKDLMGTAGARVGFICVSPAHLETTGAHVDHLTIHETDWAYCPFNVRTEGHDWKATGGLSMGELEILVRGMRERAGANGDSPKKSG